MVVQEVGQKMKVESGQKLKVEEEVELNIEWKKMVLQ
jgi:hypothetical protein